MSLRSLFLLSALALVVALTPTDAQVRIDRAVVAPGETVSGGTYTVRAVIGQPAVGIVTGEAYALCQGFLCVAVSADGGTPPVACSTDAPLFFSDFDSDASEGDPRGEFVELTNDGGTNSVDLDGCAFVVIDPFTEQVSYVADAASVVAVGAPYSFANAAAPPVGQAIPAGTLDDSPGVFALVLGDATAGQSVGDLIAATDIVAAVVYLDDDDVFGSVRGGDDSDAEANAQALADALAQLFGVAVEGDEPVDLTLAVAPNPISGSGAISFGLAEVGDVRVSVYDALGRQVAVLAEGPFGAGRHAVEFSVGSLAAGVYVVRVEVRAEVQVARITVVR